MCPSWGLKDLLRSLGGLGMFLPFCIKTNNGISRPYKASGGWRRPPRSSKNLKKVTFGFNTKPQVTFIIEDFEGHLRLHEPQKTLWSQWEHFSCHPRWVHLWPKLSNMDPRVEPDPQVENLLIKSAQPAFMLLNTFLTFVPI